MNIVGRVVSVVILVSSIVSLAHARALTFEERVRAQEAIERVYYSHQTGTTRTFEQAVPRSLLEAKVRTYLKESVAVERFWKTPITAEMLERELERMGNGSRMPDRLRELFAALGNDPVLVQECLARPALADRVARSLFASDGEIHRASREKAEALHRDLLDGRIDPKAERPDRRVVESVAMGRPPRGRGSVERVELSPKDLAALRRDASRFVHGVGPLSSTHGAFTVRVVLEATADRVRVAAFSVPKRTWHEWWASVEASLDASSVVSVAKAVALPSGDRTAFAQSCEPDDTWRSLGRDGFPTARSYHSAVWTGSEMIVWGGSFYDTMDRYLDTGGRYDPATDAWSEMSGAGAPSARQSHTAVWAGGTMVVWGGLDGTGVLGDGAKYDPSSDTWSPIAATGSPSPRFTHTAVWTGSRMIVWGGYDGISLLGDGASYDPSTDSWTPISVVGAPSGRSSHTAVWTGSRMVVWGGSQGGATNTGGRYDPTTDTWTSTTTAGAPAARILHSAVWTGTRMIVWGGKTTIAFNSGGLYDPAADTWSPTAISSAPAARFLHTAVWTGSAMVVWGGRSVSTLFDTGARYDPVTDAWTSTATTNAPSPRVDFSAVWTGTRMVVWGGNYEDTGGRYDPSTNSWTRTSTSPSGAPPTMYSPAAVWTGSKLVVWSEEGGRYDPATDTWSPTSELGAPSTWASMQTVVWTGEKMIVWRKGVGGRYDPTTDTWTPVTSLGAPNVGAFSMVWTGHEMIVWGGLDDTTFVNTGARYNPATDQWLPTSTPDAPASRYNHSAVWTGSRMVVYGGQTFDDEYVYEMGRPAIYDPATDSWGYVPEPSIYRRALPSFVWTGSKALFWGGFETYYDDGWRNSPIGGGAAYDPVTNTWSLMSSVGEPAPRFSHAAVWTGRELIVWGGTNEDFDNLATGGRYDPSTDTWQATSVSAPGLEAPSAVWSGRDMLVWGEFPNVVWAYAIDQSLDADGDGITSCLGDCNDADPATHPGAVEICDQRDNDCNLVIDDGIPLPQGAPSIALQRSGGIASVSWPAVAGASGYDAVEGNLGVLASSAGDFAAAVTGCIRFASTEGVVWPGDPAPGQGVFFLLRAKNCTGTATFDEPGGSQVGARDAEVAASEHSCEFDGCDQSSDWDNDGLCVSDNCPLAANPDQADADGDGVGDLCDNCLSAPNATQVDSDGDGLGDACDACPTDAVNDPDGDGACEGVDNCPGLYNPTQANSDTDRFGDACDNCPLVNNTTQVDSDGDGVGNACDACPLSGVDDVDGDGLCGNVDNCPTIANPGQADSDHDGLGDVCDPCPFAPGTVDSDGDGLCDGGDNCPTIPNPGQADADADGRGDVCDNCVSTPNASQIDTDADGTGDACDVCPLDPANDADGDGLCANVDNCPAIGNPSQADADADGVGDVCDNCVSTVNVGQVDTDGDGRGDVCDNCPTVANPSQADTDVSSQVTTLYGITATASSQYSATDYSAAQATGTPNSVTCGDDPRSWSPLGGGSAQEWLEVRYASGVKSRGVVVYETYLAPAFAPVSTGFVTRIDLIDTGNAYHTIWTGSDTTPCGGQFAPTWAATSYDVIGARVYTQGAGYEEIDAVGLVSTTTVPAPDGVGNVCDNCPTVNNPSQSDADHDGIGDACEGP